MTSQESFPKLSSHRPIICCWILTWISSGTCIHFFEFNLFVLFFCFLEQNFEAFSLMSFRMLFAKRISVCVCVRVRSQHRGRVCRRPALRHPLSAGEDGNPQLVSEKGGGGGCYLFRGNQFAVYTPPPSSPLPPSVYNLTLTKSELSLIH